MVEFSVIDGDGEARPGKRGPKAGAGFDPWTTTDGVEYDQDKFYTRSTNEHDHSIRVDLRLPDYLHAEAKALVDSKRIPQYRHLTDVLRDGLVHRLKYLGPEYVNPALMEVLDEEMRLSEIEQRKVRMERWDNMVEGHRKNLEFAASKKATSMMAEELNAADDTVFRLPEPWKGELRGLVHENREVLKGFIQRMGEDDEIE